MSKVTCHLCNKEIEYTHQWFGLCCPECYRTTNPKYNIGDKVYFLRDKGIKNTNFKEAIVTEGKIKEIQKVTYYHANNLGLFVYKIEVIDDRRIYSRHETKIYKNKEEINLISDHTNKRRTIERELREELKKRLHML